MMGREMDEDGFDYPGNAPKPGLKLLRSGSQTKHQQWKRK